MRLDRHPDLILPKEDPELEFIVIVIMIDWVILALSLTAIFSFLKLLDFIYIFVRLRSLRLSLFLVLLLECLLGCLLLGKLLLTLNPGFLELHLARFDRDHGVLILLRYAVVEALFGDLVLDLCLLYSWRGQRLAVSWTSWLLVFVFFHKFRVLNEHIWIVQGVIVVIELHYTSHERVVSVCNLLNIAFIIVLDGNHDRFFE